MSKLHFKTDDQIELAAHAWGQPENTPVILLHGGGQTRHAWKNTARALAQQGYYAMAFDLRGHGDSGWSPGGNYSIDRFVHDLQGVAATCTRAPILVGASLGGITGLLAEGEGPACLSALVLVDVTPTVQRSGVDKIVQFMRAQSAAGFPSVEAASDAIAAYLPHRQRPSSLEGLAKNLRLHDDGRYRWHWDPAFLTFSDAEMNPAFGARLANAARKLTLPVLLVRGGASDLVSEADARDFLSLVPHARYVDVAGAAHMVAGDLNDPFAATVLEFLADIKH